jgi:single-stranded DNA-binding protein
MTISYFTGLIGSYSHDFAKDSEIYNFSLATTEDKKQADGSYDKIRTNWISCKIYVTFENNHLAKKLVVGKRVGVIGFAKVFPFINKKNEAEAGIKLTVKNIFTDDEIKNFENQLIAKFDLSGVGGYEEAPNSIKHEREKQSEVDF